MNTRIATLRKEYNMTQDDLARRLGVGRTSISGYESGNVMPPLDKLNKMAEIFDVSTDYLLGNYAHLSKKDNNDIAQQMNKLLQELELDQNALTFNGEEMDETTRELLIQSLQNSLEMAKTIAKRKYAPSKYRKDL